jgi:hypothetical protein
MWFVREVLHICSSFLKEALKLLLLDVGDDMRFAETVGERAAISL